MKKSYLLAAAILGGTMSFAQHGAPLNLAKTVAVNDARVNTTQNDQNRAGGDLIGTQMNFDTPADWVNDGSNAQDWSVGTTTPNGLYTANTAAINSTSGGNFAMIQGDGFTGTAILTMANSVDLSANSNVAFEFESSYRNFTGSAFFEISTDGTTWTPYQVHDLVPLNENSADPELISVNISSAIVGGSGTVWARFRYESTDDYYWMVDDARFVEGYDNNLVIDQTFMSAGPQGYDYYMIPNDQISEVTFGAYVSNLGLNDWATASLGVAIDEAGTNVYTGASTPGNIANLTRDSLTILTPNGWTPEADKSYRVAFGAGDLTTTDETPNDNLDTLYNVTTGGRVYARDNGIQTGSFYHLTDVNVETEVGNIFDVMADMSVGKIQVGLGGSTAIGHKLTVTIKKWNGDDYEFLEESDEYSVSAGEPGTIVEVELNSLVDLMAGDDIAIFAKHGSDQDVYFMTAQEGAGAIVYSDGSTQANAQNSIFIVRAVYDFVGLEENETEVRSAVYPNPASDNVNIVYTLSEASDVNVTVVSVTGEVVYNNNLGTVAAGKYTENINATDLANGVYFYTLTVNGKEITKKLVISKK
jgi:hypothetical protein